MRIRLWRAAAISSIDDEELLIILCITPAAKYRNDFSMDKYFYARRMIEL